MMNRDLHQQLMEAFRSEAKERIESMFANLTALEKSAEPGKKHQILEVVYREAHSLKGAARSVGISTIESLCQSLEEIFNQIKEGILNFSTELFDKLHEATAVIEKFIFSSESEQNELIKIISDLIEALTALKSQSVATGKIEKKHADDKESAAVGSIAIKRSGQPPLASTDKEIQNKLETDIPENNLRASFAAGKTNIGDTVRISSAKLDSLLLKAEELIIIKQILVQHLDRLKKANETLRAWKIKSKRAKFKLKESGITADSQGILNRFYQMAESNHANIEGLSSILKEMTVSLDQNHRMLGLMIDELLEEMKSTSLLPFSSLFAILPRMVRDIAREQNKDIDIEISGSDIEIDKRILESIKDPILHMIRNAADHGIEKPEIRKRAGKQPWGTIRISVTQPEGHHVDLIIQDDGSGIRVDSLKNLAVRKGIILTEHAEALTDQEALGLIFQSGISTSPIITEISGRGLGMAIVKEGIEALGGSIRIQNTPGLGAAFHVSLPVTLATFRGILVSASGHFFILPNSHVEHVVKVTPGEIKTAKNRPVISLKGSAVSFMNLSDLLDLPQAADVNVKRTKRKTISIPTVLLQKGDQKIAVGVDTIINEQEVLVKNLGKQLRRVPYVSGATILASGKVVPVLNVSKLIQKASKMNLHGFVASQTRDEKSDQAKSILVVEDSFTSRTLLKNILEASGYSVKTAIDGEDGFSNLQSGFFDAVVSDVQMPKMDGFKLTQKIRGDTALSHLPVILVTSLDSPADKEKGIDVGANAYIVKSSFDQSNLLEVLERLV
ncbi:MAG: hybrid sensor histidine kinase/response regulator [Desulfobacterales bacterium]|jgi:two-component system chemotaxis sensor kinase CheA|nr:hybrid sensor histidine kinase/response regulator [Desulfobacterales bacterium]